MFTRHNRQPPSLFTMASDGSCQSEDWHTAAGDSSKKSNPWETMDCDAAAAAAAARTTPPVPPRPPSSRPRGEYSSLLGQGDDSSIGSHSTGVYIRADGKKVRRVKKHHSISGSVTSDEETLGSMRSAGSGVYVRADGKKVRRVKRSKKRTSKKKVDTIDHDIPTQVSITSINCSDTPPEGTKHVFESECQQVKSEDKPVDYDNDKVNTTSIAAPSASRNEAQSARENKIEDKNVSKQDEVHEKRPASQEGLVDELMQSGETRKDPFTSRDFSISASGTHVPETKVADEKKESVVEEKSRTVEASSEPGQGSDPTLLSATQKALDALTGKESFVMDAINPWLVEPKDLEQEEIAPVEESTQFKKEETREGKRNPFEEFVMIENENVIEDDEMEAPAKVTDPQSAQPAIPGLPDERVVLRPVDSSSTHGQDLVHSSTPQHATSDPEAPDRYENDQNPLHSPLRASGYNDTIKTMGFASISNLQIANAERVATKHPPLMTVEVPTVEAQETADKMTSSIPPLDLANTESFGECIDAFPSADAISPKGRRDLDAETEGGHLWRAASREAQKSPPPSHPAMTPKRRQLPETLMARTRSRADVDAFVTPPTPITPKDPISKSRVCIILYNPS